MPNPYYAPLPPMPALRGPRRVGVIEGIGQGVSSAMRTFMDLKQMKQQGEMNQLRLDAAKQAQEAAKIRKDVWGRAVLTDDYRRMAAVDPASASTYMKQLTGMREEDRLTRVQEMETASKYIQDWIPRLTDPLQLPLLKAGLQKIAPNFPVDTIPPPEVFAGNPQAFQQFLLGAQGQLKQIDLANALAKTSFAQALKEKPAEKERAFKAKQFEKTMGFKEKALRQKGLEHYEDNEGNVRTLLRGQPVPKGWKLLKTGKSSEDFDLLGWSERLKGVETAPIAATLPPGSKMFNSKEEYVEYFGSDAEWERPGPYAIK